MWLVRYPFKFFVGLLLTLLLLGGILLTACQSSSSASAQGASAENQRAIQNKGSDTIVNLALAWAEAYRNVNPTVAIAVTGGGTGTGITALINGTADIANASRKMTKDEIAQAQKNGFTPVEFTVAIDALAVIVNPANPVSKLTIPQLADIFTGRITNWQAVGGNDAPIFWKKSCAKIRRPIKIFLLHRPY
ncbi:MAG: substrate-binding domain-containing protein [Chloroflexi bacterium]|nr:substrate-binding domain-containing protein [Chloroflexota bacterium]